MNITKDELEQLYFHDNKSLGDIAKLYGFKSRTPIKRLFDTYNIEVRNREDATKLKQSLIVEDKMPDKEILRNDLMNFSILELTRRYGVPKSRINIWIKKYNLSNNYYKNLDLKALLQNEDDNLSAKELALKYNVTVNLIKKFKKHYNKRLYSIEEIQEKITLYNYDLCNKGFPKQLYYDDLNLYESIINHTQDHVLDTNKITEKLYRLLNNYSPSLKIGCKFCGKHLSFYNINSGYGCSDIKICSNCLAKHNGFGVSRISQKLFWSVYKELPNKENCYFNDLNKEFKVYINEEDRMIFSDDEIQFLNKTKYNIDFIIEDKIIEFDGTYWHKSEINDKEDEIKDKFLIHKGYNILRIKELDYTNYPQETLNKCLTFLTT